MTKYCCKLFELHVKSEKIFFHEEEGEKSVWMANFWSDLPHLLPGGSQIDYCPFCGEMLDKKKKAELEREEKILKSELKWMKK